MILWALAVTGLAGRALAIPLLLRLTGRRFRLDPAAAGQGAEVRVSVLVPARNEARVLGRLLTSLSAQDHPDLEILVVDDASTDETRSIAAAHAARDPRIRVLDGRPLPPGWLGKNNALDHAQAYATGELLLFVDADTVHHPAAARTVAVEMERDRLDLLVVLGRQEVIGPWERLVNPFFWGFVLTFADPDRSERPDRPDDALGNGQFAAYRRAAYDRAGGHAGVSGRIIEDVALAKAVKRSGGRYRLRLGPALTATRLYVGLPEIWRGFAKNAAFVDPAHKVRDLVLTLIAVALMVHAELMPYALLAAWAQGAVSGPLAGVAALQVASLWGGRFLLYARLCDTPAFRWNPVWYVLQPVGALVGVCITLRSLYGGLVGAGAMWKGRVVRGASL